MKKRKLGTALTLCAALVLLGVMIGFLAALVRCNVYFEDQLKDIGRNFTDIRYEETFLDFDSSVEDLSVLARTLSYRGDDLSGAPALVEAYLATYPRARLRMLDGPYEYSGPYLDSAYGVVGGLDVADKYNLTAGDGGHTPLYSDSFLDVDSVLAWYYPVRGSEGLTGILAYYTVTDDLPGYLDYEDHTEIDGTVTPAFRAFVTDRGRVLDSAADPALGSGYTDIYAWIDSIASSTAVSTALRTAMEKGERVQLRLDAGVKKYLLVYRESQVLEGYYEVDMYDEDSIYEGGFSSYRRFYLLGIMMTVLALAMLIVCGVLHYQRTEEQLQNRDPVLGCNTYAKFCSTATRLLSANRSSRYAVIFLDTNRLAFIRDRFGGEVTDEFLRSMASTVAQCTMRNETYGYVLEDQFFMMIHYDRQTDVTNRIKLLNVVLNSIPLIRDNHYSIKIHAGVCCAEKRSMVLQDILDRAMIAHKLHKENPQGTCVFFDDKTLAVNLRQADIESRMEFALKNGEFRLFFQPKYNIKVDKFDSAEVLVRWFDEKTGTYQSPAEFVPLFELNGFIVNMDHYIYEQACRFLSQSRSSIFSTPRLSVNVSRMTAMAPDFLRFYLDTKRKYGIAAGVLTLELTESFAYENYEKMKEVTVALKNNGIGISIDDFGAGYSSYNILKELPIDELKLDRFFLQRTSNTKRDEGLLSMMIRFCNDMGIKVTQEGVETMEELNLLRRLGCDVIQGFLYARPMMTSDYIDFMSRNTSLESVTGIHPQ